MYYEAKDELGRVHFIRPAFPLFGEKQKNEPVLINTIGIMFECISNKD
jgi:hypothetical protein